MLPARVMNCPCKKLFSRPAGTLDENRTATRGNIRQNIEYSLDSVVFADDIFKPVLVADFLPQCLYRGKIPENLHSANDFRLIARQHGSADTCGYTFSLTV